MILEDQIEDLLEAADHTLTNIKPSVWAEQNRVMSTEVSPFPGPFNYDRTPYIREIIDCLSPDHPSRIIVVMKGIQIGLSSGVIENGIGWIMSQHPGNILFMARDDTLVKQAMNIKIDQMIDSCGLRPIIRPNVRHKRNQRTGDTSDSKEFPGGSLIAKTVQVPSAMRQISIMYGFIDDFEAAPYSDKKAGSTTSLIETRFAAYSDKMKLFYISTPELKQTSNIEPVYELGDQRKYHVPCPCCGDYIVLYWTVDVDGEKAGIYFKRDDKGKLVEGSVGYICQSCGEFFTDAKKYDMNLAGQWKPTAKPSEPGYYSYHISALYAPPGMYDWEHYAREWIKANPLDGTTKEAKIQTFFNTVLGETYEKMGEAPKASALSMNTRRYNVGEVPEKLSISDGNGRIMLITCACDLNGTMRDDNRGFIDDARLDYEIVGWSESGASYSIRHGSIGTFIPLEGKNKADREHWSYDEALELNVWDPFQEIIEAIYTTDTDRRMRIVITGVDTGRYTNYAYSFIDRCNGLVVGLKGDKEGKYRRSDLDSPTFKPARERGNLYLVDVNQIKDQIAELMKLNWSGKEGNDQPPEFMNFPTPSEGLYMMANFFAHYESEHRVIEKNKDGVGISSRWVKRNTTVQNHLWDCRVYGIVLRDILVAKICKEIGIVRPTWKDYVDALLIN